MSLIEYYNNIKNDKLESFSILDVGHSGSTSGAYGLNKTPETRGEIEQRIFGDYIVYDSNSDTNLHMNLDFNREVGRLNISMTEIMQQIERQYLPRIEMLSIERLIREDIDRISNNFTGQIYNSDNMIVAIEDILRMLRYKYHVFL